MSYLMPRSFWSFPTSLQSFLDEDEWGFNSNVPGGLTLSEDDKNVYVEAAAPGVDPQDVDITFEKGILRITGEVKEEEKEGKRVLRRAQRSFAYQVALPSDVDANQEPRAEMKNGMVKLTFPKSAKAQPKKISIQAGK